MKPANVEEPLKTNTPPGQLSLWSGQRSRPHVSVNRWNRPEKLASLLTKDLNFSGENTSYSRHNFHAFAAKFPPQLPRFFIEELSCEGEVVLDPMVGSGTTVLEAVLLGRRAIGFDIDPLAERISRIKVTNFYSHNVAAAASKVVRKARSILQHRGVLHETLKTRFDPETVRFIEYWFLPATQLELMALVSAISKIQDTRIRALLEVAFSGIIVTKSGGVSMARDLAHSRPHRVPCKVPKNAIDQFEQKVRKTLRSLADSVPSSPVEIHRGDARCLPVKDQTVDLIVTSPPYANAIDYVRAHKFSLVWLGDPIESLSTLRSTYIGTEKTAGVAVHTFGETSARILCELAKRDHKKGRVFSKYLSDMASVLQEMLRVLKHGRCAILVVGSSTMRGLDVKTHECLAEVARSVGWNVLGMAPRRIDRDKRMMPMRLSKSLATQIEQRMSEEFVIAMAKP